VNLALLSLDLFSLLTSEHLWLLQLLQDLSILNFQISILWLKGIGHLQLLMKPLNFTSQLLICLLIRLKLLIEHSQFGWWLWMTSYQRLCRFHGLLEWSSGLQRLLGAPLWHSKTLIFIIRVLLGRLRLASWIHHWVDWILVLLRNWSEALLGWCWPGVMQRVLSIGAVQVHRFLDILRFGRIIRLLFVTIIWILL